MRSISCKGTTQAGMDDHSDNTGTAAFGLERAEQRIVEALAADRTADLDGCTIPGDVLADLVVGLAAERERLTGGMRLANAVIAGRFDLSRRRIPFALEFLHCRFEDGPLLLADSQIDALALIDCSIAGALTAARVRTSGTVLFERTVFGERASFAECCIGGAFSLVGATLSAGLDVTRARIDGSLDLTGATLVGSDAAAALAARGLRVDGDLLMASARLTGRAALDDARIGGTLAATLVEIDGGTEALDASRATIAGDVRLGEARLVGGLSLSDATVGGTLDLVEARVYADGTAIAGARGAVAGSVLLSHLKSDGRVDFSSATIGGSLVAAGATIKVQSGAALLLSDTTLGGDARLGSGFHSVGAVRADRVAVIGCIDLKGSHLRAAAIAPSGTQPAAARPTSVAVDDTMALSLAHATTGRLVMPERGDERPRGVVDLSHAHAAVFEDYAAAWPAERRHRARDAEGREIEHLVLDGFTYGLMTNPTGRATTGKSANHAGRARLAWLDGQRREDCGPTLCRQPWTMLAERFEAQGLSHEADHLRIALHRRERASRAMPSGRRWTSRLADWLMLYGLSPWRSLTLLAVMTALMGLVWATAAARCTAPGCFDESVFVITNKAAYTEPRFERTYPRFNPVGYALDLSLPLVTLGYRDHWRVNVAHGPLLALEMPASVAATIGIREIPFTLGGLLFALALAQQLLGLVLSLAVLASMLGLVRPRADR